MDFCKSMSLLLFVTPPLLAVSYKLYSFISGNEPMDISRQTFLYELTAYIKTKNKRIVIEKTHNNQVIVICRYATVFSDFPPIVMLHGTNSGSFNFVDFIESFPPTYDVYCIDLPGWGISNEPPMNISTANLDEIYQYYGHLVMSVLSELTTNKQFIFVGHSFGSFLLVKMIANGSIPAKNVHKCVLSCMSGLVLYTSRFHYFWGTFFIYGLAESPFKQWWSKYVFQPWLFRGNKSPLEILQRTHRFISQSTGYQLVSRQMKFRGILPPVWETVILDELKQLSNIISIQLVNGTHDPLVDIRHARNSSIPLYEFDCGHSLFDQPEFYPSLVEIIK